MRGKTVENILKRFVFLALLLFVLGPNNTRAIGVLNDHSADDQVMGIGGALSVLLVSTALDSQVSWFAEAGETYLFHVAGLKTSYVDVGLRRGALGLIVSAVQLSSSIGGERLLSAEPFLWRLGRFVVSGVTSLHTVSFGGRRMAHVVSLGARMSARVTRKLDVGYAIENYRVSGESVPGANTALHVVLHPGHRAVGVACVRLDRYGNVGVSVASRVRLGRMLETSLGYDDATEMFAGLVKVKFSHLGVAIGAGIHPVLGVSKSISVRWRQ